MAGFTWIMFLSLVLPFLVQATIGGGLVCERLAERACAFAVSSVGTRCVLEKEVVPSGLPARFACYSSDIEAEPGLANWVETDECVDACGLDRNTVGISSDGLLDGDFTKRLCSPRCYRNCPNVIDLYFNLAVGEGIFLPKMCEDQAVNALKAMAGIRSSGAAAVTDDDSSAKAVTKVGDAAVKAEA